MTWPEVYKAETGDVVFDPGQSPDGRYRLWLEARLGAPPAPPITVEGMKQLREDLERAGIVIDADAVLEASGRGGPLTILSALRLAKETGAKVRVKGQYLWPLGSYVCWTNGIWWRIADNGKSARMILGTESELFGEWEVVP